jgi:carboxylesterase type B
MRGTTRDQVLLALPSLRRPAAIRQHPGIPWGPVVDGLEIPDQPRGLFENGTFNRVPMIIGSTRDEGWVFVDRSFPAGLSAEQYQAAVTTEFGAADASAILAMYPAADFLTPKHALARLTGDAEYVCEARRVARLVSRTGTPVYEYSFEREVDAVVPGLVIHGLDTNFVFGNNYGPPAPYVRNADDVALSTSMGGYWTRFMATGDPNLRRRDRGNVIAMARAPMPTMTPMMTTAWSAGPRSNAGGQASRPRRSIREGERLRGEQCDFWNRCFCNPSSDPCRHRALPMICAVGLCSRT